MIRLLFCHFSFTISDQIKFRLIASIQIIHIPACFPWLLSGFSTTPLKLKFSPAFNAHHLHTYLCHGYLHHLRHQQHNLAHSTALQTHANRHQRRTKLPQNSRLSHKKLHTPQRFPSHHRCILHRHRRNRKLPQLRRSTCHHKTRRSRSTARSKAKRGDELASWNRRCGESKIF